MSSQPSQNLILVESLMQHIDTFQSGEANEMTYLSAMNALRDLHAYIKNTEKVQDAKKSSVIIIIDGEEYFIESFQDKRIAVRITDNHAYSSETGDYVGLWNEETRSLTEIHEDEDD
jgi:enterochelin esterase-like enzyme